MHFKFSKYLRNASIIFGSLLVFSSFGFQTDNLTDSNADNNADSNKRSKRRKIQTAIVVDTTTQKKIKVPLGSIEAVIKPQTPRRDGIITTIIQDDKYYFLINKSIIGRDFLVVNRLSRASALLRTGFDGYAGDQINESMIRMSESPDGKRLFVETVSTRELPRDTIGEMYPVVMRSNLQPITHTLPIKGRSDNRDTILVDVTDLIMSDSELIGFSAQSKKRYKLNSFQRDKSYMVSMKSYEINTEIRTIKSYVATVADLDNPSRQTTESVTFELNSSIVLLPEVPMKPRYADPRVGYFTEKYIDYNQDPQGIKNVSMIARYRLEPKDEDVEKYNRGELVEPKKPIIYYIDPATPEKWIPYLIQGVNDWQKAFEQAGFKNAIVGMRAPTPKQDSTWSLEDARYSAIVYKASEIPNASGPHVSDPRSGEIIESHINWYHNVMQLVKRWYMIQVGPNDPDARQMNFPDHLMGQLIRFVSSHEVGHTLGLRHNFGATYCSSVDSLRSATYLARCGHTASIMDYSRFNYVVQPEDSIDRELLYPRIQDYDLWAIEYGYRIFPGYENPVKEKEMLCNLVVEKNKNPRLWFGHEYNLHDPRSQSEDLSNNQMQAAELGIRNLKRVCKGLPTWTITPGAGYANLKIMYDELTKQFIVYNWNVSQWIGGIYETPSTSTAQKPVYTVVEREKQKEALRFLSNHFFQTPTWIFNSEVLNKIGMHPSESARIIQLNIMDNILSVSTINNIINAESTGDNTLTLNEFYGELYIGIFSELNSSTALRKKTDMYRRMLQKTYVSKLMEIAGYPGLGVASATEQTGFTPAITDIQSTAAYQLRKIEAKLEAATSTDPTTKAHYQYLAQQISQLFK